MSICPDHGGYTGDACKKCQVSVDDSLIRTKDGAVPIMKAASSGPPKLTDEDQFTLVKLESASLKAFHKMQNAQAQFQNFAGTMFQKYGVTPAEYTLDMEKLEFVLRGM